MVGMPEVAPGDDLPALLVRAIASAHIRLEDDDVLAVTQKVVSKAEGRVVTEGPEGKAGWVARETRRVVAGRDDLVIAETRHGFVCANAGVDASNVAQGFLTLLPEDPDGSAERIRAAVTEATGARIGVVVTDTFGRAWRRGVVNVAIGCAGLPSVLDLRGTKDAMGRTLEATEVALADEVAAASGLVMGKADGIPAAIVRGVRVEEPPLPASELIRPPDEDLFRQSLQQALLTGGTPSGRFGVGDVPRPAVEEAVRAALSAVRADRARRWLFIAVKPGPVRRRLIAVADDERAPLAEAPLLIVPLLASDDGPERDALLLSAGAAVQNLVLGLHGQRIASWWYPLRVSQRDQVLEALGIAAPWLPVGIVAAGPASADTAPPAPSIDLEPFLREVT